MIRRARVLLSINVSNNGGELNSFSFLSTSLKGDFAGLSQALFFMGWILNRVCVCVCVLHVCGRGVRDRKDTGHTCTDVWVRFYLLDKVKIYSHKSQCDSFECYYYNLL